MSTAVGMDVARWPARSATLAAVLMMGWLSVVLWLDRAAHDGGIWLQRGLGVLTWGVLVLALLRMTPMVRAQTAVVVAFATVVEYVFSPTLGVYVYRFDGFLQPINDTAHQVGTSTSIFKAGSTVPVKLVLKDAAGNLVQPVELGQNLFNAW